MKKRSQWIYILSLLLCFTLLFASCNQMTEDTDTEEDPEKKTEQSETQTPETEPEPIEDEEIDWGEKISAWNEYLEFREPEKEGMDEFEPLFDTLVNSSDATKRVEDTPHFYVLLTRQETEFGGRLSVNQYYNVYSKSSGKELATLNDSRYDPTEAGHGEVFYYVEELDSDSGILCVIKYTYHEEDGVYNETYSYYDASLNTIKANLTEPLDQLQSQAGYTAFDMDGKCVVYKDGEKFYECDKSYGVVFPEISETYGDYKYIYAESQSKIALVQIIGKDYNIIAQHTVSGAYDSVNTRVLSDGSVLVTGSIKVSDNETEYDFIDLGQKYKVDHILISAKDASVKKLNTGYYIAAMATNADSESIICLKDKYAAYQYAEVYKIDAETKRLSSEISFVILDEELNIKHELPAIVKNQTGLLGINRHGDIIVAAKDIAGKPDRYHCDSCGVDLTANEVMYEYRPVCITCYNYVTPYPAMLSYIAHRDSGTVELYIDISGADHIPLSGGYIHKGKLYNSDNEVIFDLEKDEKPYTLLQNGILCIGGERFEKPSGDHHANEIKPDRYLQICRIIDGKAEFSREIEIDGNNYTTQGVGGFLLVYSYDDMYGSNGTAMLIDAEGNVLITANNIGIQERADGYIVLTSDHTDVGGEYYQRYYIIK